MIRRHNSEADQGKICVCVYGGGGGGEVLLITNQQSKVQRHNN